MTHPVPAQRSDPLTVLFSARTDVGRTRSSNEDNFLVDRRLRLYIVCDGLGGHQGGEVASAAAVNAVREAMLRKREVLEAYDFVAAHAVPAQEVAVLSMLKDAVQEANARIYERAQQTPSQRGMGTTLSMLVLARDRGFVAHVGDTRVYRFRDQALTQVTEDHSLLSEIQRGMTMTPRQLENLDRLKNQVTRAVGVHATVEVDAFAIDVSPGDRYLLCSDGLHGLVDDHQLAVLLGNPDLVETASRLVDQANEAGGKDNITSIVVQLEAATPSEQPRRVWPLFEAVRSTLLFQGITDLELRRVLEGAGVGTVAAGATLLRDRDLLAGIIVIAEGEVQVSRGAEVIAVLRVGDCFGEDALFLERVCGSTIVALEEGASYVTIERRHFEELQRTVPNVALKLALAVGRSLARKVEATVREGGPMRSFFKDPGALTRPVPRPAASPRIMADTEPELHATQLRHLSQMPERPGTPAAVPSLPPSTRRPRADQPRTYSAVTQPAIPVIRGPQSAEIPTPFGRVALDTDVPPPLPFAVDPTKES